MKRKPIKVLTEDLIPFIPKEYKKMDKKAKSIYSRPLIFWGRLLRREERMEMQDLTNVEFKKDVKDIDMEDLKPGDVKVTGQGKSAKFVWDHCIKKASNVILQDGDKVEEHDEYTDMAKLWNTKGIDLEIAQAVSYFVSQSSLTEAESKN